MGTEDTGENTEKTRCRDTEKTEQGSAGSSPSGRPLRAPHTVSFSFHSRGMSGCSSAVFKDGEGTLQ